MAANQILGGLRDRDKRGKGKARQELGYRIKKGGDLT